MDRRAFDFALRAAAKITFGTSILAGCGGTVTIDDTTADIDDDTPIVDDDGSADQVSSHPVAPRRAFSQGAPIACDAPGDPQDWATFDAETFACCSDSLSQTVPSNPEEAWGFNGAPDQATRDCCTQILSSNYEAIWSGQPLPHPAPDNVIAACCVSANGNAGCTPWGPPVPPKMEPGDFVPWLAGEGPGFDVEMMIPAHTRGVA